LSTSVTTNPQLVDAFRQGLLDLGYVEGRNIVIEYRSAEGQLECFPALAATLVALKVNVIVAANTRGERTQRDILNAAEVAARTLGLRLQLVEARGGPESFAGAFAEITRARAEAVIVLTSVLFASERKRLVDLAAKNRLPAMYPVRTFVDGGGLMSYGTDLPDLLRRAALYVDKILKGAQPSDLPVEQPTKFELVINLKTAKVLGVVIPASLLARADQVIDR
jgi:putative ABC transport system substrate-binding protein